MMGDEMEMGTDYVPRFLDYSEGAKAPVALLHKFVEDVIYPTGTYNPISTQSIIRFDIKRDGWWDPYSAFFKMTIQLPNVSTLNQPTLNPLSGQSPLPWDISFNSADLSFNLPATGNYSAANSQPAYAIQNWYNAMVTACSFTGIGSPNKPSYAMVPILAGPSQNVYPQGANLAGDVTKIVQNPARSQALVQLDGSALSFFDEIIITDGTNELNRTRNAPTLFNILKDMNYGSYDSSVHSHEGFGGILSNDYFTSVGGTSASYSFGGLTNSSVGPSAALPFGAQQAGSVTTNGFFNPLISQHTGPQTGAGGQVWTSQLNQASTPAVATAVGTGASLFPFSHLTPCTTNLLDCMSRFSPTALYPQTKASQKVLLSNLPTNQPPIYFPMAPINQGLMAPENLGILNDPEDNFSGGALQSDVFGEFWNGLPNAFNANFCTSSFETIWTTDIMQNYIMNGLPTQQYIESQMASTNNWASLFNGTQTNFPTVNNSHTFLVPFPSTWLGCLVPRDKYKFIYLGGFKKLMIELRMNPYALFTSFWSADNSYRRYVISQIELHFQLAEFYDSRIQSSLSSALSRGLEIQTFDWYNCLEYPITGSAIPNNININVGFNSLKAMIFCFEDMAYQSYSCYRRHWRLSHCLTSLRLKVGQELYPSLEYKGNGGTNLGAINNFEFYYHLLSVFGKHFTSDTVAINPHNFALNQRRKSLTSTDLSNMTQCLNAIIAQININIAAYNAERTTLTLNTTTVPSNCSGFQLTLPLILAGLAQISVGGYNNNTAPAYTGPYALSLPGFATTTQILKSEAATLCLLDRRGVSEFVEDLAFLGNLQLPYYFENAVIGKAVYALDLDALNYDGSRMSGISTVGERPFDLLLSNAKGGDVFSGGSTLIAYGLYDLVIKCRLGESAISEGVS